MAHDIPMSSLPVTEQLNWLLPNLTEYLELLKSDFPVNHRQG